MEILRYIAVESLQLISAYDALIRLKSCLGGPKLQYVLHTSSISCGHSILTQFDDLMQSAVTKICNTSLTSDDQWIQASLPVWSGGRESKRVQACINGFFSFCCWISHPPDANSSEQPGSRWRHAVSQYITGNHYQAFPLMLSSMSAIKEC